MNHQEFYKETLNFVDVATKLIKLSSTLAKKQTATAGAVKEKSASVAKLLVSTELIDSHQVKQAESQLSDPAKALDVLRNVVDHFQTKIKEANAKVASATLGTADSNSSVGSSKKQSNYLGRRRGSEDGPTESDQALLRLLK